MLHVDCGMMDTRSKTFVTIAFSAAIFIACLFQTADGQDRTVVALPEPFSGDAFGVTARSLSVANVFAVN